MDGHNIVHLHLYQGSETGDLGTWRTWAKEHADQNVFLSEGKGNGWGTFRLVDAPLAAMARYRNIDYDHFINLSGQCYPIHSQEEVRRRLEGGRSYLEVDPLPNEYWRNGGMDRINRFVVNFAGRKVFLPRLHDLPGGLRPYGGSAWFCLAKRHVDLILSYIERYPEVVRFFRHGDIPDETFFHTLLMNLVPESEVVRNNLRYYDWTKPVAHLPAILTVDNLDKMMASGKLFARKFDPAVDARVLDLIDRQLRSLEGP